MLETEVQDKLKAEFPRDQITFRPGSMTKDKKKGLPLAYIDARDVMNRLDDVLGCMMWKDEYEFHGTRTICKLSVYDEDGSEWIAKCDGAGDTNIEGEKGGLSDAFKRAAVKWGIGRYLYDLRFMYREVDQWKKFVGDPWDSLITKKNPPKNPPKPIDLTKQKQKKAEEWKDEYIAKLDVIDNTDNVSIDDVTNELINLQTKNSAMLKRMAEGYPDLHKVIVSATDKVRDYNV